MRARTRSYARDASSCIRYPLSHLSSQNKVVLPSLASTLVAARNSCMDSLGTFIVNSLHGLLPSTRCSHGHLACIATFNLRKWGRPRPPTHFGVHTVSHATAQFPPLASALRHHRNPRQILFMVIRVLVGRLKPSSHGWALHTVPKAPK